MNLIMVKNMLRPRRPIALPALVVGLLCLLSPPSSGAETALRPAVDWRTGLAIYGFDPVAYFADGRALAGTADYENAFAGATWRFRNAGNREAFAQQPEVYAPAFGGYDPSAIARGVALPGNPLIFALHKGRVFLFETERAKNAFMLEPTRLLALAESRWPALSETIAP